MRGDKEVVERRRRDIQALQAGALVWERMDRVGASFGVGEALWSARGPPPLWECAFIARLLSKWSFGPLLCLLSSGEFSLEKIW